MSNESRSLRAATWLGVAVLIASVGLTFVFPRAMGPLPPGMRTPVLALELARSRAELETMFGPAGSPERAQWIAAVTLGDTLDFGYIALYVAFLISAARGLARDRPRLARTCTSFAWLAGVADVVENLCLFVITTHLDASYDGALVGLVIATWLKWLSLALVLALLAPALRARRGFGRAAYGLLLAPLPLALAAAFARGVLAELMLLAITLAMIALFVEVLRARRTARA